MGRRNVTNREIGGIRIAHQHQRIVLESQYARRTPAVSTIDVASQLGEGRHGRSVDTEGVRTVTGRDPDVLLEDSVWLE
ncbi:MAG: hypothetical protein IID45_08490 [Planctomycetes bacterium]|nr:hypothetical protein [Planctomycetota bacterium]